MKMSEIKELTTPEIVEKLEVLRKSYDLDRINHSVSPLENPASLRAQRQTIARLEIVLAMRRVENQ